MHGDEPPGRHLSLLKATLVYMLIVVGGSVAIVQFFLFPNDERNFDPHWMIHVYAVMGIITLFVFWKHPRVKRENLVVIAGISRFGIIGFQLFAYFIAGAYNQANEVNYYSEMAKILLYPDYFSQFRGFELGVPPGYQGWLMFHYFIYWQYNPDSLPSFARDMIYSSLNAVMDVGILVIMQKIATKSSISRFLSTGILMGVKPGNEKVLDGNGPERFDGTLKAPDEAPACNVVPGLLFYAISVFNLYFFNVRNFMEPFPILLGIAGIYFFIEEKPVPASVFLVASTLTKITAVTWIMLAIFHYWKTRRWKDLAWFVIVAIITGGLMFLASSIHFGLPLTDTIFKFLQVNREWAYWGAQSIQLNQSYLLFLFTGEYYIFVFLALIIVAAFLVFGTPGGLRLNGFTAITGVFFVLQPWFDQRYITWLLPFACIDLLGSKRAFQGMIALTFISVYLYLFFIHFPWDWRIDTYISNDPLLVGTIYRILAQPPMYIALGLPLAKETWSVIKHRGNRRGQAVPPGKSEQY